MRRIVLAVALMCTAAPFAARAEPKPVAHEVTYYNRSAGFWTSDAPAVGGPYKLRLAGIGAVVGAITAWFVVRALRRAGAERKAKWTTPSTR